MQLKNLFPNQTANFSQQVAEYLFKEQTRHDHFIVSADAAALHDAFLSFLKKQKATAKYERSVEKLAERPIEKYQLIRQWLTAFLQDTEQFAQISELCEYELSCSTVLCFSLARYMTLAGSSSLYPSSSGSTTHSIVIFLF